MEEAKDEICEGGLQVCGSGIAAVAGVFVIARDPVRLRPLMIPAVVGKLSYVISLAVLVTQGRTRKLDLLFVGTDCCLEFCLWRRLWQRQRAGWKRENRNRREFR